MRKDPIPGCAMERKNGTLSKLKVTLLRLSAEGL